MKKLLTVLLISTTLLFIGCEGDEGPIGPQGPTGPAGIAGPAGPAGEDGKDGTDGEDGEDGNANVNTKTFVVAPSQWQVVQSGQSVTLYLDTNISILTDEIINNGSAHLYLETNIGIHGTDKHWMALPTSYMIYYLSIENRLTVNTGINYPANQETAKFKLVTIAGNLETGKVDFNNYQSVKEYFRLKDF